MQKNAYMVPWADKAEWERVRSKIYSEKIEDVIEAYETMTMWQLRSSSLPAYVDCTVGILQVMVEESLNKEMILNDYNLRLSYSTALIRFINHVHGVSDFRSRSLYRSAKTQNIPDWLITMRHDAAHGRVLPALETFHLAAKVSLQWLMENYWYQEEKWYDSFGVYNFEHDSTMNNLNLSLLPIYKTAIRVWGACCELINNSLRHISDLSEDQLSHTRQLIHMCKTNDCLKQKGSNCVIWLRKIMKACRRPELFETSRKKILKALQFYIQELLQSITLDEAARYTFVQSLLQSDFMLDTTKSDWENVIYLVQSLKCFSLFLESIFELAALDNDMAVNLLKSLLPSIKVLKREWSHYLKLIKSNKCKNNDKKIKKIIKIRYKKKCKNLNIRLKLQAPPKIKFDMLQNILSNPSNRSYSVILKCLSLVEPSLPEALRNEVTHLVNIYCGLETYNEDSLEDSEKIFTLGDIERQISSKSNEDDTTFMDSVNSSWIRSNESAEVWSNCPLGLLPHQKAVNCNLPIDVIWKMESSSEGRKRASSNLLTSQSESMKKFKKSLKNIVK